MIEARQLYYERQEKLQALENKLGFYLVYENVDDENVSDAGHVDEVTYDADGKINFSQHEDFWEAMVRSQASGAGMRAEEHEVDINELLGEVIY
jgi:hypothetical protein